MLDKLRYQVFLYRGVAFFCVTAMVFSLLPISGGAAENISGSSVIVSLGDSYSSGEGIPPFYGQDKIISERVDDQDWLAHRSQHSWSGMLRLPTVEGTMAENRGLNWFFAASSGAETVHLYSAQPKEYDKWGQFANYEGTNYIPPQLKIFEKMGDKKADYVTLTLGGNDAGFASIITAAVMDCGFLKFGGLEDKLDKVWDKFEVEGGIKDDLRRAYRDIAEAAGSQAKIIVAGYPKLLAPDGSGLPFSKKESQRINQDVSKFNDAIEDLVAECRKEGINIYFVSVESAFESHGAYSDEPYINEVIMNQQEQDLDDHAMLAASCYSIHPNLEGAKAYARCVQSKINELEGVISVYCSTNLHISVLGVDDLPYNNYSVVVEGRKNLSIFGFPLWGFYGEDYYQEISVTNASPVRLELPEGKYSITVTDGTSSYTKYIKTREQNDNKRLVFVTNFGQGELSGDSYLQDGKEPIRVTSDERDVVLVLDVSGSMSGTPMDETKKASTNFIETVLMQDASIGIVTYDSSATCVSDFSINEEALKDTVSSIYSGGTTNIDDGLSTAQAMLHHSNAKKKIIVLMSDGIPNEGREGDELVAYAQEIKDEGILIYTLGFFEDLGSWKPSAQSLMEQIASDGCHYEVANAEDLVFFFEDMADQINGTKYIYVRIACPVDVFVTHNGETLSSAEDNLSLRTDFGTLTFEENEGSPSDTDDRIKILRLKEGADYDIQIFGTGRGIMDYTIGFMDEDGEYSDLREFENIKITKSTVIDTVANVSDETFLNVDSDGDGRYDVKYRAEENGYGEEIKSNLLLYISLGVGAAGTITVIIIVFKIIKKFKKAGKKDG